MPTEHHYRAAAERYRGLARQYADQAAWTPTGPAKQFITAPAVSSIIDDRFVSMVGELTAAADEFRRLAVICDSRADTCRSYRWSLWGYHQATPEVREHLRHPVRPYAWVDV